MRDTGIKLLWGTANLFGHPRYAAGAATNPNPEVFAHAAAQVKTALELTHQLGGENYVLWGGREGYDTLLNTDLKRESDQLGRFMQMVVEHKHKIGFRGTLLIEPKPCEPTKHQYDYDSAACYAFLQKYGLTDEFKLNIECNHATLAGHTFQHEVAYAIAHGIFGSIDANRGDPQNGWDTDQYPNSVEEATLVLYEILRAGGLQSGGFNFDAKLRRQSVAREDLFYGHIGGMGHPGARFVERCRVDRIRRTGRARREPLFGVGRRVWTRHPERRDGLHKPVGPCPLDEPGSRPRQRSPGASRERRVAVREIANACKPLALGSNPPLPGASFGC